ncbi:MAG TPA: hypothetical protein VFK02_06780 [Kofleriaceae bacterium]|nr:hypothetical protein [Kofleriaceae bacterium]
MLALSVGYAAWQGHSHSAYAAKGGDDDEEGDDGGDDEGAKGGDEGSDEGDEGADDKDQPAVTAGGLFTMKSYPVSELLRPLTMTQKIAQVRVGVGTDISAKGAFGSGGLSVEALYGMSDNFTILGGLTDAYNFRQFGFYAGFEGALVYDLLDIRLAANVHRNAIPGYSVFCNPPVTPNEVAMNGTCMNTTATQDNLPNGDYAAGDIKFSIDLGFPFRYAIRPEIAIVALQTLMSIDFNSVDKDYVQVTPIAGATPPAPTTQTIRKGNGAKPDLNPSLGIATNPIPQLSLVVFGQLRIPDFDTSAGAFQIPVTGRVEVSPNQKFDIGLEFTLLNVKPPEGQSPIDNRFISLFLQSRIGK